MKTHGVVGTLALFALFSMCTSSVESVGVRKARNRNSKVRQGGLLQSNSRDASDASFLQTGAQVSGSGEHGYCELCMYSVHQVQYGALPTCGGSSKSFSYSSCSQVVQSMLKYAHDVMHLIQYGCYQYDPYKGWQTIKPCPAHVICGRLPNVYDHQKENMCPNDHHYRFPHALSISQPKADNPLLAFAIKQYAKKDASSIKQEPNAPGVEGPGLRGGAPFDTSQYSAGAYPKLNAPGNVYAQQTNPVLARSNPSNLLTAPAGAPASERSTGNSVLLEESRHLIQSSVQKKSGSSKGVEEKEPSFLLEGINLPFKRTGTTI